MAESGYTVDEVDEAIIETASTLVNPPDAKVVSCVDEAKTSPMKSI